MGRKANKIIQVPVPQELLDRLDRLAYERGESRSAMIREACTKYITATDEAEKVRRYLEGYRRSPEDIEEREWAEMGARMLGEKYAVDEW